MNKTADMLTEESVSILTINEDGERHRSAYENSKSGRELLLEYEPEDIVSQVMEVWGDSPTVEEPEFTYTPEEENPSEGEAAQSAIWDEMAAAIKEGVNAV